MGACSQPDAREGQAGPFGVSERFIVPSKPCNYGGGKEPQFQNNVSRADSREIGASLEPPVKVGKPSEALHAKAKGSPGYRFYLLYDKMHRADVLAWAYDRCRENRGVSGIDDQTFDDIEKYGRQRWLDELAEAYNAVDRHTTYRLCRWLQRKYQVGQRGRARFSYTYLYQHLGLICLPRLTRLFPWAKA